MSQNILNLKNKIETQERLYNFLDQDGWINGGEIRQWISECVVHFTDVGVPENIISIFLERLEYKDISNKNLVAAMLDSSGVQGPFAYHRGYGYKIATENRLTGKEGGEVKMTSILVAFKVSENLLEKFENETRLIPSTLVTELDKYTESKTISVSLGAVQASYEEKNTKGMLSALISTTDSLMKLIPELSDKEGAGSKIKKAYETKAVYENYSMSREILWSLNNARIVRNIDTHNPDGDNETTLYEAVSYAHLLVLLILSVLSSGNLKLTEEK